MKDKTFVSITEKYKYSKLLDSKRLLIGWLAPVLDSPKTEYVIRLLINTIFTGLVFGGIAWCFDAVYPLRIGFGIAVTIIVVEHKFKWVLTQLRK